MRLLSTWSWHDGGADGPTTRLWVELSPADHQDTEVLAQTLSELLGRLAATEGRSGGISVFKEGRGEPRQLCGEVAPGQIREALGWCAICTLLRGHGGDVHSDGDGAWTRDGSAASVRTAGGQAMAVVESEATDG